jgi:site-specific DNA-methyltransferase (adenine-specific)
MKHLKTQNRTVRVEQIAQHPIHKKYNTPRKSDQMEDSICNTGNKPIHPPTVVPDPNCEGAFLLISGMIRLDAAINVGIEEIEVQFIDTTDENEIEQLVIELNKQKELDGYEKMMVFYFYLKVFPQQKGIKGSRYHKIGKATNMGFDRVKDLVILINFFEGDGQNIIEKVFGGDLTIKDALLIKRSVQKFPEKFNSIDSFEKISNPDFYFGRLAYAIQNLSVDNDNDFVLMSSYLKKDLHLEEFQKLVPNLGKVKSRIDDHESSKIDIPELTETYKTKNSFLIKGDNREVILNHPFGQKVAAIVGSSVYGIGEKRIDTLGSNPKALKRLSGQEFGIYLAETYEPYKQFLEKGGSMYNIIADYKNDDHSFSCSLEHFVIEMEKRGMYLVGRYCWTKTNSLPNSYTETDMGNGFEMIYRFVLDPENYYNNTDLFLENELFNGKQIKVSRGCVNHSNDGKSTKGGKYIQSHLKKLKNVLDEKVSKDVIRGNAANPEDFFRQANETKHTSTAPVYLTSVLIMESTKKGDLVMDIWNGTGNTMTSSLLLGRQYVGIEKEETYFKQTCRRAKITEELLDEGFAEFELIQEQKQAA